MTADEGVVLRALVTPGHIPQRVLASLLPAVAAFVLADAVT
ncbi:hypothetical protein [Streptomyces pimonensis]